MTRLTNVSLLSAGVLLLTSCGGDGEAASEGGLESVSVAITSANVPLEAAVDEGIFEQHGLDVETSELPDGTESIAAVSGGSAEFGYADLFAGMAAIDNGFELSLVQSQNGTSRDASVWVTEDSEIQEPSDLEGATIGLGVAPFNTVFASLFFEYHDIDPDSVTLTTIRSGLSEALISGELDAIVQVGGGAAGAATTVQEAHAYDLREIGDGTDAPSLIAPDASQAGFFSPTQWADDNTDTVENFAEAVRASNRWWDGLSDGEKAEHLLTYSAIDLVEIDEQVPGALEFAADGNNDVTTGALNVEATNEWVEFGHEFVPENVPHIIGEDLDEHIYYTATRD